VAASGLPLERGSSSAVGRGRAGPTMTNSTAMMHGLANPKCIHFCSKCLLLCLTTIFIFPATNHMMHAAACVGSVSMFRAAGRSLYFIPRRVLYWLLDSAYNTHTAVYCRRDHPFSLIYTITRKKIPIVAGVSMYIEMVANPFVP